ncbi:hypothetical protein [Candidatus Poriferisocius sp.]
MTIPCRESAPASIGYGERLDEIGAVPSVGSVGDSYDCEHDVGCRLAGV